MTTENTPNANLDISDIQSVVAIIDYAAEQGAYKGWQVINQVAGIRSRLAAFLEVVAAAQKAKEDAEAAVATDAVPDASETNDEHVLAPGA